MLFLIPLLIIFLCLLPVLVGDSDKYERDKKIADLDKEINALASKIGGSIDRMSAEKGRVNGVTIDDFDDEMLRDMDKLRGLERIYEILKNAR